MFRILMTTDTVGGVWTFALELARGLSDAARPDAVEIALLTMGAPLSASQRAAVEAVHGVRLYESAYKLEWMNDPWDDVARANAWMLDIARAFGPDVIHLNNYAPGALSWDAPVMITAHSDVFSWWRAVHGADAPPEYARYRETVEAGLRGASLVTTPSRAMLDDLRAHYRFDTPTRVIPLGRAPLTSANRFKEPFVLTAGRLWDKAKNIAALEAVAADLPWKVYAAGATASPDADAAQVTSVRPLGMLRADALAGWYARAAIYALPASYEPFGLSILEAAAAGCALVLGDIPSLRENWEGAALFVPPNDHDALRRALAALIQRPTERTAAGKRAQIVAARFTPERMARGYMAAYRQLARRETDANRDVLSLADL